MRNGLFIVLLIVPFYIFSQSTIELNIGAGQTAIDIEHLVDIDEVPKTVATDWGLENYGVGVQYFLSKNLFYRFGAEVMYQHQYWYDVKIPNTVNQYSYREYSVESLKITPILRLGSDILSIDLGPEFNFNDEMEISLGLLTSFNYNIKITENIFIPIKLRVDIISGTVVNVPLSLNTGICVKI